MNPQNSRLIKVAKASGGKDLKAARSATNPTFGRPGSVPPRLCGEPPIWLLVYGQKPQQIRKIQG
jgi:hypothetical protein